MTLDFKLYHKEFFAATKGESTEDGVGLREYNYGLFWS